jgi:uncharacterized lipoprotein YbaY
VLSHGASRAAQGSVAPRWAELKTEVALAESMSLPAGSLLRLTLQDLTPGVPKDASITTQTTRVGTAKDLELDLRYNRNLIDPTRSYGLSGAIIDARGRATWETAIPVRVLTRGFEGKARLVLKRVTASGPPPVIVMKITCGELTFEARVTDDDATLLLPDGSLLLKRTEAASVASYSDGASTLNVMGGTAYFRRAGKYYRDCVVSRLP